MLLFNKPRLFYLVICTHGQLQMTSILADDYFLNCFDHAIFMMYTDTHSFDFAKITEPYLKKFSFCDFKEEWALRTLNFAKGLSLLIHHSKNSYAQPKLSVSIEKVYLEQKQIPR